ncbi:hypothetical protein B0I73DRAFT_48362 [Yarrowia lipolytica]|jgi:hypothetical protein|uniref:G patch domain-containing protein n=1 Tax=Yarrowia lipolytica TaxID=4952 RepID=A0A371C6M1_YARLL|nr:Hypothetical protein YALI2_B00026g [Yarrowia lipolytica]RDW25915.1 hypothetical protein B0I71DRAFT_131765 [Yarrowia lipolytica]RDW38021.1 hypothetical protein B0I73DRAFT_48362 [Yarrowia lipolytica]RDW45540.1 hypothetical protein B0I74DRAFT_113340 [Yarrowia lipolytica]RDW52187.1 hypothetical protein B0I75DRAFT_138579 [Yarrowia lipolytica]
MYTPYGTPVKNRNQGKGLRNDFAYDKNGLRRFHGAFEGGWSAGYYNTVGSQEGWTPRQWSSSKDSERATNTIEDYVDGEDDHREKSQREIVNVGPGILARWSDQKNGSGSGSMSAFEVLPETPKVYQGPAGIGYEARLVDPSESALQTTQIGTKRLTMGSTNKTISIVPGSGKKRPLLLEDEEEDELYPVTKSLPKLRKDREDTGKPKSVVKHKFLTAAQRQLMGKKSSGTGSDSTNSFTKPRTVLCSDGKLPLPGFSIVLVSNPVYKQYGLHSTPVTQQTLQTQVDSFLDSLNFTLASENPYKSKLDSKFQLAGSAVEGPKEASARTVVQEWVPSKLLCKRMGIRYEKPREEDVREVTRGGFGREKIEKLRRLFS